MALTDALIDALAAGGVSASEGGPKKTSDGKPLPTDGKPFVVIWPDGPVRTAATLADGRGEETTVLVCHCAGLTPQAARIAEAKLADAVYGLYQTVIDGQSVSYPVQDWAEPMKRDDDVSPSLYDLAVEWRIRTRPV